MSEMQRDGSEMRCKRCGANESRIHGFCSVECEHYFDYEEEITDLNTRIAELELADVRRDVAAEKGLTPAQAKRLQGDTREELEADADEILDVLASDRSGATPPPTQRPKPAMKGGTDPTVEVNVQNQGTADESDVTVSVSVDGGSAIETLPR